jgi:hypothetical protein
MVKVIPFEQFVDPAVIAVTRPPFSISCTSDDYIIAATDKAIEFFHASKVRFPFVGTLSILFLF